MAFKNGLSERLDELRFPSPRSPPADAPFAAYTPLSPQGNLMSSLQRPSTDVRANLQRRFTTDAASKLSSWSFVQPPPPQSSESIDMVSSVSLQSSPLVSPIRRRRSLIDRSREQPTGILVQSQPIRIYFQKQLPWLRRSGGKYENMQGCSG